MKGEVFIEVGMTTSGKYWLAAFITGLDNQKEAVDIAPELQRVVNELVQEKVRHGLYVVPAGNDTNEGLTSQD
jgi:ABC-type sugar transport system ATPase subunit